VQLIHYDDQSNPAFVPGYTKKIDLVIAHRYQLQRGGDAGLDGTQGHARHPGAGGQRQYMHATNFKTIMGDIKFGPDGEWAEPRIRRSSQG
jgi:hypothetical protein